MIRVGTGHYYDFLCCMFVETILCPRLDVIKDIDKYKGKQGVE